MQPFIGVIVSPYNPDTPVPISRFQFWNVGPTTRTYGMPYVIEKEIVANIELPSTLYDQLVGLVREYRGHVDKVDLGEVVEVGFGRMSRLEKMLCSVGEFVALNGSAGRTVFMEKVREVVVRGFIG